MQIRRRLGLFIRDIGNFGGIVIQFLFFLTPVFYPISALPEAMQPVFRLNPLSVIVEDFRRMVMWGLPPDWLPLGAVTLISGLVMLGHYVVVYENQASFC